MKIKQILCSVGVTLLVGGLCAFLYGHAGVDRGGTMDGLGVAIRSQSLMLGGGIAAAVGAGLTVFGRMITA